MWEDLGTRQRHSGSCIQVNIILIMCPSTALIGYAPNGELLDSAESSYFLLDESLAGNITNVPSSDIYTPKYKYLITQR